MGGASVRSENKKYLRVSMSADWLMDEEVEHRVRTCTAFLQSHGTLPTLHTLLKSFVNTLPLLVPQLSA